MARYKKIDVRIWNDAKFNALSSDAQLIFLYLLTSPQTTMLGAVPVDKHTVSRILKFDDIRYGIGYKQLSQYGMLEYDEAGIFWIKNFLKYNPPENPKVVISYASLLDLFPECPLLIKIAKSVLRACEARGDSYVNALHPEFKKLAKYDIAKGMPYGIAYGMPYQEQEQEQEQEKNKKENIKEKNPPITSGLENQAEAELPFSEPENQSISKTETVEKKAKRKTKAKQPCPFNDGDAIPEDFLKIAEQYHIANPQLLFQKMISYCKSNGKEYVDYKAAFRTFCIQDQERNRGKQSSGTNSNNSAPMPYEPPGGFTEDYYRKGCKFDDKGNILL